MAAPQFPAPLFPTPPASAIESLVEADTIRFSFVLYFNNDVPPALVPVFEQPPPQADRGSFSHALRQSRNVVHPYEHARARADFDEATCKVCWQVLNASVDDLLGSA